MLRYDESANVEVLKNLQLNLRVAFSLLSVSRAMPAYSQFYERTGRGAPEGLRGLVDLLWRDLNGESLDDDQLKVALDEVMSLIPSDEDGWDEAQPYAEDAAAGVAYAFRARLSGDPQEAAWAARRVYESADRAVMENTGLAPDGPQAETEILNHPLVQAELSRQVRDLKELLELSQTESRYTTLAIMRQRCELEATGFFGLPQV